MAMFGRKKTSKTRETHPTHSTALALDIGTAWIKAIAFSIDQKKKEGTVLAAAMAPGTLGRGALQGVVRQVELKPDGSARGARREYRELCKRDDLVPRRGSLAAQRLHRCGFDEESVHHRRGVEVREVSSVSRGGEGALGAFPVLHVRGILKIWEDELLFISRCQHAFPRRL